MKKEYRKITNQTYNEEMQPIGEPDEMIITSLIADTGKVFHHKQTGFTGGTRIDLGTGDSEENYEEIDDPKFTEVIDVIVKEVSEDEQ